MVTGLFDLIGSFLVAVRLSAKDTAAALRLRFGYKFRRGTSA
jgi:hypothetical protein